MQRTYEGANSGRNAGYRWEGNNKVGAGRMTIVESVPPERVAIRLEFTRPMRATNRTTFTFVPKGLEATDVTWSMEGNNGFMAKAFGLQIHYHNRRRVAASIEQELEATYWDSLDQMIARMDIVSVNCPHTPATYHLLSARRLKLLQPHAIIVNTARGEIIDENALARMLEAGEIAGAGLDVYVDEPNVPAELRKLATE